MPSSSRTSTPSGTSGSGSSSSASATSRATTSPASRSPTSASSSSTPARSTGGRGRSTSSSCTRCSGSTCRCTGCAPRTASTPAEVAKFFQGRDSRIMETDRAMWDLVGEAQAARHRRALRHRARADPRSSGEGRRQRVGVAHQVRRLPARCTAGAPRASPTPTSRRGSRTPPRRSGRSATSCRWTSRTTSRRRWLASQAERDAAIETARSQLSGETLGAFNELLAINQVANFAWWNEDHNHYIDLRASIPLRRGALALGEAVGANVYDDALFLFFPEFVDVCSGRKQWKDLQTHRDRTPRVLRPLQRDPRHLAEGRRHVARQDRGSGAHRDLRHARPLLRAAEERPDARPRCPASPRRRARSPDGRG